MKDEKRRPPQFFLMAKDKRDQNNVEVHVNFSQSMQNDTIYRMTDKTCHSVRRVSFSDSWWRREILSGNIKRVVIHTCVMNDKGKLYDSMNPIIIECGGMGAMEWDDVMEEVRSIDQFGVHSEATYVDGVVREKKPEITVLEW